jgi:hypothetical protein
VVRLRDDIGDMLDMFGGDMLAHGLGSFCWSLHAPVTDAIP